MFAIDLFCQYHEALRTEHLFEKLESLVPQFHPLSLMLAGATVLQCLATLSTPAVRDGNAHWLSIEGIVLVKEDGSDWHGFRQPAEFRVGVECNAPAGVAVRLGQGDLV